MGAYGGTDQASKSYSVTGSISGTITDQDTGDPITDATVTAGGYSDTTDSAGVYTIAIPVETYTVSVSGQGYVSQYREDIVVQEGQTTTVDFQLDLLDGPYGAVSGTVTDADKGGPIAEAVVTAGGYSDTASSEGVYSIAIPVGTYAVSVSANVYQSQSIEDVEVQEDQTTMVDFQLTGSPDIAEPRGGCGCHTTRAGDTSIVLLLLIAGLLFMVLRPRRRS